jgi:hypothetical protein
MPLELGVFLGCQRFGSKRHRSKTCLVLDTEKYRFQKFISDIAGQDIYDHSNDSLRIVERIRDWLRTQTAAHLDGAKHFVEMFKEFKVLLPTICSTLKLDPDNLTFTDLVYIIKGSSTPKP